jgi:hypothetical protein
LRIALTINIESPKIEIWEMLCSLTILIPTYRAYGSAILFVAVETWEWFWPYRGTLYAWRGKMLLLRLQGIKFCFMSWGLARLHSRRYVFFYHQEEMVMAPGTNISGLRSMVQLILKECKKYNTKIWSWMLEYFNQRNYVCWRSYADNFCLLVCLWELCNFVVKNILLVACMDFLGLQLWHPFDLDISFVFLMFIRGLCEINMIFWFSLWHTFPIW